MPGTTKHRQTLHVGTHLTPSLVFLGAPIDCLIKTIATQSFLFGVFLRRGKPCVVVVVTNVIKKAICHKQEDCRTHASKPERGGRL